MKRFGKKWAVPKGLKKITILLIQPITILLFSDYRTRRKTKTVCSLLYGFFLGYLFYRFLLRGLHFGDNVSIALGLLFCLIIGLGNALSVQIRCISLLALPAFCGKSGRATIKALALALVIAGPITNLADNGKEVIRVFACSTVLTYNLTKTRFSLMVKPFQQAIMGVKADMTEVKNTLRSIRDVSLPIMEEIDEEEETRSLKEENDYLDGVLKDTKRSVAIQNKYDTKAEDEEAMRYQKKYMKKIASRCESQLSKGVKKCHSIFSKAYDTCYSKVHWIGAWILCWPMKLTFVCNFPLAFAGLGASGSSMCDVSQVVDPGMGEGYVYLKKSRSVLSENFKAVKVQYKMVKAQDIIDVREATDTAKSLIHNFKKKQAIFKAIMLFIKRILAFVFLKIILSAQKYHDTYLSKIEHNNVYVTNYFRRIDMRRRKLGKHTLLPLKKVEKAKFVDPWSLRRGKTEGSHITSQVLKLMLEMITAVTFVLLDRLFYEALTLVGRHARIDYTQEGHHDMSLVVKGTGMIASLLRSLVKGFNIKNRIKTVSSNEACLPRPNMTSVLSILGIFGTYLAIFMFILFDTYAQRLPRVICAFFYPKREKRRTLHLYNNTLKRRRGLFKFMKNKVKTMVRQRQLGYDDLLLILRFKCPKYFSWLRVFPFARRSCVICNEPEPRKRSFKGNFEPCSTQGCPFVHCADCWNDIGQICLACHPNIEDSDDNGSDFSGPETD